MSRRLFCRGAVWVGLGRGAEGGANAVMDWVRRRAMATLNMVLYDFDLSSIARLSWMTGVDVCEGSHITKDTN